MSSILIRGAKMPKNCAECKMWGICDCLLDFDDYESICDAVEDGDLVRDKNCPLVEVPPHSDLVDRNNLLEKAYYDYNETTHDYNKFRVVFEDDIIDAPVIIPAE